MKTVILLAAALLLAGCPQKSQDADPTSPAPAAAAQPSEGPQHKFRAAQKAADDIEAKGQDRASAAEEAMKAGK